MKVFALFLIISVISINSFSQTSPIIYPEKKIIGSVKRGPYLIAELSFVKNDSVQINTIKYLDAASQILKSIKFEASNDKIEEMYTSLKAMFELENGTNKEIVFGDILINLTLQKMMGLKNILLTINESSNFGLNTKEIDKLFGK